MRNDGDDIIMMMMAEFVVDRRKEEKRIHFHNKCHVYMILIPGILIIQFAHTHSHTTARAHATKCEHILYELPFSVIHPFSLYAISGKCVSVGFSFQFALNKAKQKKGELHLMMKKRTYSMKKVPRQRKYYTTHATNAGANE